MKKAPHLLATFALALLLAGCQNSSKPVPNIVPPPTQTPTPNPSSASPTPSSTNGVVEKGGLKIEGNVSSDFTVTKKPAPTSAPQEVVKGMVITGKGFLPSSLTVDVGTTVIFVNNDTVQHWPASDPHPTHTLCPGFDSKKGLKNGETYSFTFKEAKTCTFHDHLNPSMKGTITVK